MSERIYVSSSGNPMTNVNTQYASAFDVRYSGLVAKPRLHPRLIIRRFRRTQSLTSAPLSTTTPIEFHNFILTNADEEVEEKFQITETFGPDFVFLYGPKPRIFTYSGVLYNTTEKPWVMEWQRAWDNPVPIVSPPSDGQNLSGGAADLQRGILSGTNVIINGGIARLEYDGSFGIKRSDGTIDPTSSGGNTTNADPNNVLSVREGYIIKFSIRRSGDRPNAAAFQLVMIVTNRMDF